MPGAEGNNNLRVCEENAAKPKSCTCLALKLAWMMVTACHLRKMSPAVLPRVLLKKISALMEKKFAKLQSYLDKLSNRIEDNTKRITKMENHISEGEDRTTSLEGKVVAETTLESSVLKKVRKGDRQSRFLKPSFQTCWDWRPSRKLLRSTEHTEPSARQRKTPTCRYSLNYTILVTTGLASNLSGEEYWISCVPNALPGQPMLCFNGEKRIFKSSREAKDFLSKNGLI